MAEQTPAMKRWLDNIKLLASGGSGIRSSVPEGKELFIKNKEDYYEKTGKLKKKKLKVVKGEKSLDQLSKEGNADEILRRIKQSK